MIRMGDIYATLALDPERLLPRIFAPSTYTDPLCPTCGRKIELIDSSPGTHTEAASHTFRCPACGETISRQGELQSHEPASAPQSAPLVNRIKEHYVAASFKRYRRRFFPGPAIECPDAAMAIQRAQLMLKERQVVGAVAFSRRVDPVTGAFEAAIILKAFGDLPEGFDIG